MDQYKTKESDYEPQDDSLLERWFARATIFELLAMGLLVTKSALVDALSSGEYKEAYFEAASVCAINQNETASNLAYYRNAESSDLFRDLRSEYTRLFAKAPEPLIMPYIGIWNDREQGKNGLLFVGKKTVEIEHFMRRCGVAKDLSTGQANDPVDHVGTVCEFMKYLCLLNARAIQQADTARVDFDDFSKFHSRHYAPYALWCANQIHGLSSSYFYLFLADLLEATAEQFIQHK